ncbi:unnamed protein product [Spirodela intermedia]|uniref:Uncharacterized protein n=1 Tax=Spirodela intermedia TaxID=51605 RepID=A0A7I8JD29_SPIIN|nr:unnamed protein product [Spirodela intermedia]CAA6668074.1 unnamed protein product [Spirodela intermedia]
MDMEMEMKKLESCPPHQGPELSASTADDHALLRYTSLRDIIFVSPRRGWSANTAVHVPLFNDSAVQIRNHLVKHAASAYLRPAAVLYTHNQNCMARLWTRMIGCAALPTGWGICLRLHLSSCMEHLVWSFRRIIASIVDHVGGGSGGGRTTIT